MVQRSQANLERERRLDFAADCLVRFKHCSQRVEAICKEFGVQWRQANRYLTEASRRVLQSTKKDAEQHRADAYAFYWSIVYDLTAPLRERIAAQKRLDRILGLEIVQHRHSGPDGSPLFDPAQQQQILADPEAAEAAAKLDEALCEAQQANTRLGERNGHCPS